MLQPEPRNPFYFLLLIASLVFSVTAVAYYVLPLLEDQAAAAGNPWPPSPPLSALRTHGWKWVLWELAAVFLFGVLSMVLDRLRSLQKERGRATIPSSDQVPPSP